MREILVGPPVTSSPAPVPSPVSVSTTIAPNRLQIEFQRVFVKLVEGVSKAFIGAFRGVEVWGTTSLGVECLLSELGFLPRVIEVDRIQGVIKLLLSELRARVVSFGDQFHIHPFEPRLRIGH